MIARFDHRPMLTAALALATQLLRKKGGEIR
jgi:hypothetical protein